MRVGHNVLRKSNAAGPGLDQLLKECDPLVSPFMPLAVPFAPLLCSLDFDLVAAMIRGGQLGGALCADC